MSHWILDQILSLARSSWFMNSRLPWYLLLFSHVSTFEAMFHPSKKTALFSLDCSRSTTLIPVQLQALESQVPFKLWTSNEISSCFQREVVKRTNWAFREVKEEHTFLHLLWGMQPTHGLPPNSCSVTPSQPYLIIICANMIMPVPAFKTFSSFTVYVHD